MGELPKGWCKSNLGEFTRLVMGQSPSSDTYNFDKLGLPFFQGKAEFQDLYPEVRKYCSVPLRIAEPNATLLSVRAPVGPTNLAGQKCCVGRGLAAIHPLCEVKAFFIFYLLRSMEPNLSKEGTGSTFQAINKSFVENIPILVPPIGEQGRIVEKIEQLFSELDKGVEALKTAQAQLKVYRQALLKHAFEGKLTADWREANKDKLESADALLARIKTEREARYQQQLENWKQAIKAWHENGKNGKNGKKPAKPAKLQFGLEQPLHSTSTQRDWAEIPLQFLAIEAVLGKMLDKQKNIGTNRPYLGNINVRWGRFDLSTLKEMKFEETEISRYSLKKNDLVICEGGEPGRCAVWTGDDKAMFIQKALHRVRFPKSFNPHFAYHFLTFAASTGGLAENFTGTTIKHLTGKGLGQVIFPLCTYVEQKEIVQLLEEKLSVIDKMEIEIETQLKKSEALRQSILKKAFSGQLVPQDPSDEPASKLLERIKAEKARTLNQSKSIKRIEKGI